MPAIINNIQPYERRGFQMVGGSAIALVGTTNQAVFAFTGSPALMFGSRYATNSSSAAPAPGSGGWVNVVNDAVYGTTFKFVRRGIYRFDVTLPVEAQASALGYNVGLVLDSTAANLLPATNLTPLQVGYTGFRNVFGWAIGVAPVLQSGSVNFGGTVLINDELARYDRPTDLPQAAPGVQGLGVVRLQGNNNAGAAIGGQFTNFTVSLWCQCEGDVAG